MSVKITINGKPFTKKNYSDEIRKAIKDGTEKELNTIIRKVNKVFNERTRTLEKSGLNLQSSGYSAIKKYLYGDSDVSRLTGIASSKLGTIDDKIKYLNVINQALNNNSMSVGGMKVISAQNRDNFKILQDAYNKGGEKLQSETFQKMMEIKDKAGLNYNYTSFFDKHSDEIQELTDKALSDYEHLEKFDQLVDRAIAETYGGFETVKDLWDNFWNDD